MNFPTPSQKAELIQTLENALRAVKALQPVTSCNLCDHFDGGYCNHWEAQPPADFLRSGCEHFLDQIPF